MHVQGSDTTMLKVVQKASAQKRIILQLQAQIRQPESR